MRKFTETIATELPSKGDDGSALPTYHVTTLTTKLSLPVGGEDLTLDERRTLATARSMGYYRQPKGCKLDDIAAKLGRPRATVHYHLKSAERKVLEATWLNGS